MEDSATAEISRSQVGGTFLLNEHETALHVDLNWPPLRLFLAQVWQWIRHRVKLEDDGRTVVTRGFVRSLTHGMTADLRTATCCQTQRYISYEFLTCTMMENFF